jgi:hypothetical protein
MIFTTFHARKALSEQFVLTRMVRRSNVWNALNTPKLYGLVAIGTQRQQRQDALSYVGSLL